jgi:predicted transcriptional regulator of viral defense system
MKVIGDALPPTFTTEVALAQGVHPRDLYAWRDVGQLVELSRGVFRRADAPPASYPDALAVSYRSPRAILCCVSAATVHELTDELPPALQIAVPKRSHTPVIDYPPVQVLRFEESTFELGLSSFEAAPAEPARVYDPARTVVDLMRFRRRFGEPVAHAALHRYLASPSPRPALLLEYARALRVFGPVRTALDVMSAR